MRRGYFLDVHLFGRPTSIAVKFKLANESDGTFEYQMGDERLKLTPEKRRGLVR